MKMKKMFFLAIALSFVFSCNAQNYVHFYMETVPSGAYQSGTLNLCEPTFEGLIVHGQPNASYRTWEIYSTDGGFLCQYEYVDSITIIDTQVGHIFYRYTLIDDPNIQYKTLFLHYAYSSENPFLFQYIWKRHNTSTELQCHSVWQQGFQVGELLWSTGETSSEIMVTDPGEYYVVVTNPCGCDTFSIEVRDNVEIYRATVDLETNLNKTTWQVTPEQAEYISEVKVYRDGLLVGTVPYEQGYYLDAIGSDNAARNYRIVGVSVEGEDCPIESYEKGTIHTTYYEDVNGNLNMTWNVPYVEEGAQGTLTYFQICKYDPNTGEITVVDQVNASITDYTCGVNQFDGGYAVIAAVFNDGRGVEELSFSNLTTDILSIGENGETGFSIYPNPAKDRVIVEGTGTMIVTNTLGQTVMVKEINGKATIELQHGLYFVKMNGVTRKIVME